MMKREAQRRKQRARERNECHGYQRCEEAEELRAGLEALIAGSDDSVDRYERVVAVVDIQELLDRVDARAKVPK